METIIKLIENEGGGFFDFFFHKNKPTVQKDGYKYEIFSIELTEDRTVEITGLQVYPCYNYKLCHLTVDSTWRKTSIDHIQDIIQHTIDCCL